MPVMDGLEAAKFILEINTGVPIIAMTANVMAHDRELYKKIGMKDCLGKPFRVQELYSYLAKYLTPGKWDAESAGEDKQFDDKLKLTLMGSFLKDNRERFNEFTDALATGDIKLAHRLVHTLKSSAALLGKTTLQEVSAEAERLLEYGENQLTQDHLDVLKNELTAVIDELTLIVQENAAQPVGDPLSEEEAKAALAQLKPLLESGSANCMKYIDDLRRIQGSNELLVQKLIQQMEDLDFEQALETFNKLKSD
jgi:CheY-like chemotaxis protein